MLTLQFNKEDIQMKEFVEKRLENYKTFYSDPFDGMEMLVTVLFTVISEAALKALIELVNEKKSNRRLLDDGVEIEVNKSNNRITYNYIINNVKIDIHKNEDINE